MGARLKGAAYGLNDAPPLWWNRLGNILRPRGLVPTRADRCCHVLYAASWAANSAISGPSIWAAESGLGVGKGESGGEQA
eukprot:5344051-Prorocentrum_lima.AAC.1